MSARSSSSDRERLCESDTDKILQRLFKKHKDNDTSQNTKAYHDETRARLENELLLQWKEHKQTYSRKGYVIVCWWLCFIVAIIVIDSSCKFASAMKWLPQFILVSDTVLVTLIGSTTVAVVLIGSTTVAVVGLFTVILRGAFSEKLVDIFKR